MAETYPRAYAHYVLLERLGTGGMSDVDLARKMVDDGSFVRFAVIKRIKADRSTDESFIRMFKDEARITSELHHENIGVVYDFGKVDEEYYLALEYVPGIDARFLVNTLRERNQRVPVKVALRIVADVLGALDYAHNKKDTYGRKMGIVHRDVNPRNVMLSIRGEVKLIDFGVAKATDRLEHTRTDHVKGKYGYMAPEQISGLPIDHRTDVYAAGLLLHELLSGMSPFVGLNQVQILHRMTSGRAPDMPRVPELKDDSVLRTVHDRALAQSPTDRYQTAADFVGGIRSVAEPIGGLPTNDQLAAFLYAVDPELTARLQRKMEVYGKVDHTRTTGHLAIDLHEPDAQAPELHGSLDTMTVTRTGVLAGSFLLVSMVSSVLAAGMVGIGMILAFLLVDRFETDPPAPAPAPVAAPAPVPVPAVVPIATPVPVAAPETDVRPRPVRPREPVPVPEPVPEPEVVPEPVPVEVPEPVTEPEPVAPIEVGFLNVTAPEKGLPVLVDGASIGVTALQRHKIGVGTYTIEVPGYSCTPRSVSVRRSQVISVTCK